MAGLRAWYGTQTALRGIDLQVPRDCITAVIGPSGSGKSTLLRCLNRLHELLPEAGVSGKVHLGAQDLFATDPDQVRRRIGLVLQRPTPFPTQSILANLVAGLQVGRRLSSRQRTERVQECLQLTGLWDDVKHRLRRPATELTYGQQQRLCLARALALRPEVLLLDDPTATLDPVDTRLLEETLRRVTPTTTVILVTNYLQQAARISDFAGFMLNGQLVEFGSTADLFTRPKDRRTWDYLNGRFG